MSVAAADIKKTQDKVSDSISSTVRSADQSTSGEEPPSGFQGKGTADEPYDQGNQPEQSAAPDTEPEAGKQGAGSVDKPYDQGNQQEQNKTMSIVDELSRTKTKDEIAQRKARRESKAAEPPTQSQSQSQPQPQPAQAQPAQVQPPQAQPVAIQVTEAPRGRDQANSVTTSTSSADGGDLAPKRERPQFERSVSPGQLPDGSHVRCSGERGEAYSPPTGLSKFKNKILH